MKKLHEKTTLLFAFNFFVGAITTLSFMPFAFFPIMLTIILASFPSGLVVYWTVNNILTIAQQWVIMKKTKIKTN